MLPDSMANSVTRGRATIGTRTIHEAKYGKEPTLLALPGPPAAARLPSYIHSLCLLAVHLSGLFLLQHTLMPRHGRWLPKLAVACRYCGLSQRLQRLRYLCLHLLHEWSAMAWHGGSRVKSELG